MRRARVVTASDEPAGCRAPLQPRAGQWWWHPATERGLPPGLFGAAALAILLGTWCLPSLTVRDALRERGFDRLLPLLPERPATGPEIAIIDIDRDTLTRLGPWPWPRARLAALVGAAGAGTPAVIAVDILLAGPDRFSAKALLGPASVPLAAALPDGDRLMADALRAVPSVLGFGLDSGASTKICRDAGADECRRIGSRYLAVEWIGGTPGRTGDGSHRGWAPWLPRLTPMGRSAEFRFLCSRVTRCGPAWPWRRSGSPKGQGRCLSEKVDGSGPEPLGCRSVLMRRCASFNERRRRGDPAPSRHGASSKTRRPPKR